MTSNAAEKRAARDYARTHGIGYRDALATLRARRTTGAHFNDFVTRLLIEAIEGCGIRHWARITDWRGADSARIADIGGEVFVLDADTLGDTLAEFIATQRWVAPLDLDSFHADEIVQTALFGGVIYRSQVRRRPAAA